MKEKFWIFIVVMAVVLIGILLVNLNEDTATPIGGDEVGCRDCEIDSDCAVFGETGDCNCGCYNKDMMPTSSGGECFCAAPTSCECIDGTCEGVFATAHE